MDASTLQWVSCLLCGSPSWKKFHTESGYSLVRCRRCRFVYVNPQPTTEFLFEHYQAYLPKSEQEIQQWGRMMLPVIRAGANLILSYSGSNRGRLLDVGCGFGFFLSQMRGLGFDVQGIDIAEEALHYAREKLGLVVSNQQLSQIPDESYDILTAFYVIEHVPNPKEVVEEFYRILKPGGILMLRWPHTTPITLMTRPFYDFKLHDTPSHLSDFSAATMRKMLQKVGFQKVKTSIGGYTAPPKAKKVTALFGSFALYLESVSKGALLMPGVSKNTIGLKEGEGVVQHA